MRVLLATGDPKLDDGVARLVDCPAGPCYHRHVLADVAQESGADTVVLGCSLPGEEDLPALVLRLRLPGRRVILLPGDPDSQVTRELMRQVLPMGVYDFVHDPVDVGKVVEKLHCPGTMESLGRELVEAAVQSRELALKVIPDAPPPGKPARAGPAKGRSDDDIPAVGTVLEPLGVIMDEETVDILRGKKKFDRRKFVARDCQGSICANHVSPSGGAGTPAGQGSRPEAETQVNKGEGVPSSQTSGG